MHISWLIFSALLVGMTSYSMVSADNCSPTETQPCTCSTQNGFRLSLQHLMEERLRQPLYVEAAGYIYYIAPCNTPLVVPKCRAVSQDIVGCQMSAKGDSAFGMGLKDQYAVVGDPQKGTVAFINNFTPAGTSQERIMKLMLECSPEEAAFTFVNQSGLAFPITYNFRLQTKYACVNQPSSSSGGLSAGSVLVILFFVTVIVYLVGGVLFLKYVRKAEGREIIPNYEFWTDFPRLVKDGVMFTFRGCKAESTYEQI